MMDARAPGLAGALASGCAALVLVLVATGGGVLALEDPAVLTRLSNAMCREDLYMPISPLISDQARAFLQPRRPVRFLGNTSTAAIQLNRLHAHASWQADSERYRAAFIETSSNATLGGVGVVIADPKPGLGPDGAPRSEGHAAVRDTACSKEAPEEPAPAAVLLFMHGGGYQVGDPNLMYFAFAPLAAAAGLRVYAPDYRLAPEHTYPAALDDAMAVYRQLIETVNVSRIALAGDSAGGNLAAALLLRASLEGLPLPAVVVLFSPWTILRGGVADTTNTLRCADSILHADELALAGRIYAGGTPPDDPLISPALADWGAAAAAAATHGARMPPVLITGATRDILLSDGILLHRALRRGGIDSTYSPWDGVWHSFNSGGNPGSLDLPEGAEVIAEAATFIRKHMPWVTGPCWGPAG